MEYDFLIDTYDTERLKILSVWSTFINEDLSIPPHPLDKRDRNTLEHMVHHRVEQGVFLRLLGRVNYSVYGPSIDSECLAEHGAVTIYPCPDIKSLIGGELAGGRKAKLPGVRVHPVKEKVTLGCLSLRKLASGI